MGGSFQITGLGMKVRWSVGVADSEECDFRPDGCCTIRDVELLGAGLGCDGDAQGSPSVELLGEVNDEPGFAGARR